MINVLADNAELLKQKIASYNHALNFLRTFFSSDSYKKLAKHYSNFFSNSTNHLAYITQREIGVTKENTQDLKDILWGSIYTASSAYSFLVTDLASISYLHFPLLHPRIITIMDEIDTIMIYNQDNSLNIAKVQEVEKLIQDIVDYILIVTTD